MVNSVIWFKNIAPALLIDILRPRCAGGRQTADPDLDSVLFGQAN